MQMYNFLDNLKISELSPDDRERLDRPITKEEIELAVSSLQSGKSPGPDGFPTEFFRSFSSLLVPHLSLVLSDSFKQNKLPVSFSEATITLIAKKEKDPTQSSSYRLISLLNVDVKILAKIMAHRVENVLPSVISIDQNGFIKNRHSYYSTRRLFSMLYSPASAVPECVLSLGGVDIPFCRFGKI